MAGYTGEFPPRHFNFVRYCLEKAAQRTPDKPALIVATDASAATGDTVWTFAELEDRVLRIAAGLARYRFRRGARVFIRMHNTPDYALVFLAAAAIGLVPIPASSQLTEHEVDYLIADSTPSAIAVSGDMTLPASARDLVHIGQDDIAGFLDGNARADYADTLSDDPAYLIYTSGTSGTPKGVLHGHRAVWGRRPMYHGWYGIGPDEIVLHTGAFNWTYTLGVGMLDPWANGATAVLYIGRKDIQAWPALIARLKPTIIASVPTIYRQMLKYCDGLRERLASLRHGLTAGEPMPPALLEEWHRATGLDLYESLGMSEVSTYVSSSPIVPVRPGSPGKPQPGRSIAILPLDGGTDPLPSGETGLLGVHRTDPGLMLGYWNPSASDEDIYRGDWFCGGDLGSFDKDGYLWFSGRNDDVMNAMGLRVSPDEVERALSGHDAIAEVAVSEVRVRGDLSVIAAFIVVAEGAFPDENALARFASERLAAYKCPKQYYFVETLPRTANGKIKRKALTDLI